MYIQTFQPEHLAIQLAARHDFEAFAKDELESRRVRGYPPFGRLARVLVRSQSRQKATEAAHVLADRLAEPAQAAGITILGPQPCPIERLSRFWRFHFLLKAPTAKALLHLWDRVRGELVAPPDCQLAVDVDPQSTL